MFLSSIIRVATPLAKTAAFIAGLELIQKGVRKGINLWKRADAEADNGWENVLQEPPILPKGISNELLDGVLIAKSAIKERDSGISAELIKKVHTKLVNEEKLDKYDVLVIYIIRSLTRDFTINLAHLEMNPMKAAKEAFKGTSSAWAISEIFAEYDNKYNDFYKFIKVFEKNYWLKDCDSCSEATDACKNDKE